MNNNGWICPKCRSVYAPFVSECYKCNNNKYDGAKYDKCLVCGGYHGGLPCPKLQVTSTILDNKND